jgi:hypothetical protein
MRENLEVWQDKMKLMPCIEALKRAFKSRPWYIFLFLLITLGIQGEQLPNVYAQASSIWSVPLRIPGFNQKTEPPIMIADHNQTVHAFSSQWFGEKENNPQCEIVYNHWSLEQSWTKPTDIILSPMYNEAWITSVFLDNKGYFHITFVGGNDAGANLYYSKAPAIDAGNATTWNIPVQIGDKALMPKNAVFEADNNMHFAVLYGGNSNGNGIYSIFSSDGGETWTRPSAIFLTQMSGLLTYGLRSYEDENGWMHAVWEVATSDGQGRGIYYSKLKIGTVEWSNPIKLASVDSGYGVLNPTITGNEKELIAVYADTPKITFRESFDNGTTWEKPIVPFVNHIGVNGNISIVKDSNDELHLFFGQRVPGMPDMHGMWHSIWINGSWSEPEAVISGPQVIDHSGDSAFDLFDARAVLIQGNILLITWRSDPGLNGNGVWFSYEVLNVPQLPVVFLPTMVASPKISLLAPTQPVKIDSSSVSGPTGSEPTKNQFDNLQSAPPADYSFSTPIVLAVIPVILLIIGWALIKRMRS